MPDHWHGLIELDESVSLSLAIGRFKNISAHTANWCLDRRGAFWERAFHDRALRKEDDLPKALQYIAENPVRARLCERAEEYPFAGSVWTDRGLVAP